MSGLASVGIGVLVMGVSLGADGSPPQQAGQVIRIADQDEDPLAKLFHFESALFVNLHHLLMQQAAPPGRGGPRLPPIDAASWSEEERATWQRALDHYRDHLVQRDLLFDQGMVTLRNELSRVANNGRTVPSEALDDVHAQVLNEAAAPYRTHLWPEHDALNREFGEQLWEAARPFASSLPDRLCELYETMWPSRPIRVDLSVDAGWAGAYCTDAPPHVMISSTDRRHEGMLSVEILFHEASHVLIRKVMFGLARECERRDLPSPGDLWHATLFFSAGEAVREQIGDDYVPYAERFGLWKRGPWPRHREVIEEAWRPYFEGEGTLDDAIQFMADVLEDAR